jgi:hypothetical protein
MKTETSYQTFYAKFFSSVEQKFGAADPETLMAIIGFDAGGPLNFRTFGSGQPGFVTYVSCELAAREEQHPSSAGRYELMVNANDERWVRRILTDLGRESLCTKFDHHHTMDIGAWVDGDEPIQGLLLEVVHRVRIGLWRKFAVLRCIGITRRELEYALRRGVTALLIELSHAKVYPYPDIRRASVV